MRIDLAIIILYCCLLASCQSSPQASSEGSLPTLDTANFVPNQCYQIAINGWDERWELQIADNSIAGTGAAILTKKNKKYKYEIAGLIEGQQANVRILIELVGAENDQRMIEEVWKINAQTIEVVHRELPHYQGKLIANRVNCINEASAKDEKLYDGIYQFDEGIAMIEKEGLYGLIDSTGKEILAPTYKELGSVSEGTASFYDLEAQAYGIIDIEGNVLVKPIYSNAHPFNNGVAAVVVDGKWGFMNRAGKMVIKPRFISINLNRKNPNQHPFNEGLANVCENPGEWGFIDNTGKTVIPFDFAYAGPFENGEARVQSQGQWYYIDTNGDCVRDCPEGL